MSELPRTSFQRDEIRLYLDHMLYETIAFDGGGFQGDSDEER